MGLSEVLKLCTNRNENELVSIAPENEDAVFQRELECGDFVYISTKSDGEVSLLREAMIRGYVEMSQINLNIAAECLYAEFEAQHTVERRVSGG